jgi:hypothetical protein
MDYCLQKRLEEMESISTRYPTKIAVICILDKHIGKDKNYYKFLLSKEANLSTIFGLIRRRFKISPSEGIFILNQDATMLNHQSEINSLYQTNKDREDGFLYLYVSIENTFGKNIICRK